MQRNVVHIHVPCGLATASIIAEVMAGGTSEAPKELLVRPWQGKNRMIIDPREMGIEASQGKQFPNSGHFGAVPPDS
jgi:hypothetical protein